MHDPIDRRTLLAALASALVAGCGGSDDGPVASSSPPPPAPAPSPPPPPPAATDPQVSSAVAIKWSRLAVDAMLADAAASPPGLSPMEQSRILAMVFIAGHDALNGISPRYATYLPRQDTYPFAKPEATYELAVARTLQALLPAHKGEFEAILTLSIANQGIVSYADEIELGEACAARILAHRVDDGAAQAQGPYAPVSAPGAYQPTPPVDVATFVNWGAVRPFVATSGAQFRAPPPYAVTDDAYTADFDEVRRLGAAVGSQRSADQSELARFWLESTPLSWQRIVTDAVANIANDVSLWFTARLFARLQMAQADAYITSLETKYHYAFWRPVTAIRAADADGNPATMADPDWMPFDPVTPPVPEYPSAHATAGTAGAAIALELDPMSDIEYLSSTGSAPRTYQVQNALDNQWAWDIASEIGLSRIYVGYHFRRAVEIGWDQGRRVGEWVSTHALPPI